VVLKLLQSVDVARKLVPLRPWYCCMVCGRSGSVSGAALVCGVQPGQLRKRCVHARAMKSYTQTRNYRRLVEHRCSTASAGASRARGSAAHACGRDAWRGVLNATVSMWMLVGDTYPIGTCVRSVDKGSERGGDLGRRPEAPVVQRHRQANQSVAAWPPARRRTSLAVGHDVR
jgi:hypothetical protein